VPIKLVTYAVSDIGRVRSSNQDGGYTGYQLHFVADGMGGHAGGDIASAMVSQRVAPIDNIYATPEDAGSVLLSTLLEANAVLSSTVKAHPEMAGMGTTFSGLMFTGDKAVVAHIGDSRIYRMRGDAFEQVTTDHTFVQRLVDTGRITPAEALVHPRRNVLMRVLGDTPETPQVDSWVLDVLPGDRFLLCSDGLCGYVSDELIERNMRSLAPGSTIAEDLLGEALEAGAPDNVTIVTVDVLTSETPTDYEAQPTYVGSAANDVVIADRKGRRGLALLNPRKIGDLFRGSEETTDFVPESDEFLEKVLADTRKRIFNRKVRQVLTIIAISAAAISSLWGGYAYTQTKFYVGESAGEVVIFQGIRESLGPLAFSSVKQSTGIRVEDLTEYSRGLVDRTIYATDLCDAYRILGKLAENTPELIGADLATSIAECGTDGQTNG
jgi:protein phosphatase